MANDVTRRGTVLDDRMSSTSANEAFDLLTGSDEIVFSGVYGNDKVTVNKDETLNLQFDAGVAKNYEIKGNDVVVTTKSNVRYYATAKITGVGEAEASLDGHKLSEIDEGKYAAKGITKNADGSYTLKFVMGQASSIGTEGSDIKVGDNVFTSLPVYDSVQIMLNNADFAKTSWTFDGLTLSDVHVYEVNEVAGQTGLNALGSEVKEITADYKKAIASAKDYSYNAEMFAAENRVVESSVTLTNFAKSDIGATSVTAGSDNLKTRTYDVTMADKATSYKGTWLNERISSTSANETFDMGTGKNTIVYNLNETKGGEDKIVYSKLANSPVYPSTLDNENSQNILINGLKGAFEVNDLTYEAKGNDLVINADVKYFVTAKADADFTYDGVDYKKDTVYKFELKKIAYSENTEVKGNYAWICTSPTREMSDAEAEFWGNIEKTQVGMILETSDVTTDTKSIIAGDIKLSNITVYESINGADYDVTGAYKTLATADAENKYAYNKTLAEAQGLTTITVKDYMNESSVYTKMTSGSSSYNEKRAMVTVNGADLEDTLLNVEAKGTTFTGTRLDDIAVSTSKDETFKLGAGYNEIVYNLNETKGGKDTIVYSKPSSWSFGGNTQNIQIRGLQGDLDTDILTYEAKGNDLVINADVEYVVKAIAGADFTYDGISYTNGTEYKFVLKKIDYTENTEIKGNYAWICVSPTREMTDDEAEFWGNIEKKQVGMILETSDLLAGSVSEGVNLSSIKVYEVINNNEQDVTAAYKTLAGADIENKYAYNKTLAEAQGLTAITVKDYMNKSSLYTTVTYGGSSFDIQMAHVSINDDDLENILSFEIKAKGTTFTGTRFDDIAVSTSANETFNLGTGEDEITFSGSFGKDTVTLNKGEELNLDFDFTDKLGSLTVNDILSYNPKGANLEVSTDVKYYVVAKADDNFKYDGIDYKKDTEYRFELKQIAYSENTDVKGKYAWICVSPTRNMSKTEAAYWGTVEKTQVGMILETGDIKNGSVNAGDLKISGIKVYQSVNGEVTDVTTKYNSKIGTGYDFNSELYVNQISGTVTVKNFMNGELTVNTVDIPDFEVVSKNNKFTGTNYNDVATSTDKNETFDLKQGEDTVNFKGKFGNDSVILTKDETINLNIYEADGTSLVDTSDANVYKYEVVKNDLVLTAKDTYYVTAKADADFTYDGIKYTKGTEYRFELKQIAAGELAGKTAWLCTSPTRNMTPAEAKIWAVAEKTQVGMVLEQKDIKAGSVDQDVDATNTIKLSNISVFRENLNGVTDITAAHRAGIVDVADYSGNATLYNGIVDGTITLKNYAAKDTGATIYINDPTHSNSAFVATFNMDESDITKGQVKGSTADDVINVAGFVSDNGIKGVTINSGSGNDNVTGSVFNDTVNVKSLAGDTSSVTQNGGENKVTFGKGNDSFTAALYSSNTVNMGTGKNTVTLGSIGTNKITAGTGTNDKIGAAGGVETLGNTFNIASGNNTITSGGIAANAKKGTGSVYTAVNVTAASSNKITTGAGNDLFDIDAGLNTINSGAGNDKFDIANGYNTIKTGAGNKDFATNAIAGGVNSITTSSGNDAFRITNGVNTIKSMAGNDVFTISGGTNVIDGGAGNDVFTVTGGDNIINGGAGNDVFTIGAGVTDTIINGGAGNDTYDASALNLSTDSLIITDTSGVNALAIANKACIFFDVSGVRTDKTGTVKSYKVGNEMIFTGNAGVTTPLTLDLDKGVDITTSARNAVKDINVAGTSYTLDVSGIAESVAGWLATSSYKSAAEVMDSGNATDMAALAQIYIDNSAACYKA